MQVRNRRGEVRKDSDNTISGYAAVYYDAEDSGTEFDMFGVRERIAPGAFDRAIREDNVVALFDHRSEMLLGRTASGTLQLSSDSKGLRYDIDMPDTQVGRDVMSLVSRGDLAGSSFAFMPDEVEDEMDGKQRIRNIMSVRLFDVGPVTYPAYASATASRSEYLAAFEADARRLTIQTKCKVFIFGEGKA